MVDSGPRQARINMAAAARQRLEAGLDEVLGDRFRTTQGKKVDVYTDGIVISAFNLFDRPRADDPPPVPFVDSVVNARRRVGLLALRQMAAGPTTGGTAERLGRAVEVVMDSPDGWPLNLRDWVESIDPAGRAAVAAAALTWCEAALRLVGTDPRVQWSDPQFPASWMIPGRSVRLSASFDATIGNLASGEKLLMVSDAVPRPTDRIRAGFVALVRAVGMSAAPERVTTAAPSTGAMERVTITHKILELAVDQVVQAASLTASSRSLGEDAEPSSLDKESR